MWDSSISERHAHQMQRSLRPQDIVVAPHQQRKAAHANIMFASTRWKVEFMDTKRPL